MNAITQQLSQEQRRLVVVNRWFELYDDVERRRNCPSSHHEELLRQVDEMDRLGLIDWREWRDLRRLADRGFLKAIAGADYHPVQIRGAGSVSSQRSDWLAVEQCE